jgi:hypothetical protein
LLAGIKHDGVRSIVCDELLECVAETGPDDQCLVASHVHFNCSRVAGSEHGKCMENARNKATDKIFNELQFFASASEK